MRWRKLMLSGGAAIGAAAAYNALAGQHVPPLDNALGGEEGTFRWRGHRVAYTRRGAGSPLLLVHSIHAAASSYEWLHVVDALAEGHTVYTLDLVGFGLSDRPHARYTARFFIGLIGDFAAQVIGGPCTLVASSLSAAYAIVLGARDPGRFPSLVLVQPTGLVRLHDAPSAGGDSARLAFETPIVGTALFNGLVSRRSLRYYLERVYADDSLVTDELVDAYYATSHQPGAKHAAAAFVAGHLNLDVRRALRRLGQPTLLLWGGQARETPVEEARGFLTAKPDLDVAIFDGAGDLPHDERPEEFIEVVRAFLARASGARDVTPRGGSVRA
ncbi:MAG TPA: alpha/beta fold hydrolase [Gemmatimonadaceae bacterium]|nr:alpha/beta fold hydrolase [Gemmatimonadaceae bacterium]